MIGFTTWLRDEGYEGFLGEFGIPHNQICLDAMDNILSYLETNADVRRG